MIPLCYFSISLSPILTVSLSVCLLKNRKTLLFFYILNCEYERLWPCSECTSATGEPSTEMEQLKCSCPYLSLAVLSTLQPPECVARVQACMHVSVRSSLHLCICREIRQDTATFLLADHAVRILFFRVSDHGCFCSVSAR